MSTADDLLAVSDRLRRNGRVRGHMFDAETGQTCLLGAVLAEVIGVDEYYQRLDDAAPQAWSKTFPEVTPHVEFLATAITNTRAGRVRARVPGSTVTFFNDDHNDDAVLEVVEAATRLAKDAE